MKWLIDYCESLSWYDSDLFDNEIVNEIIIHFVNDRQTSNSHYKHLFQKMGIICLGDVMKKKFNDVINGDVI